MPLTGLTGLSPYSAVEAMPEESPEIKSGSADPRHGQGTLETVYPWQEPTTPGPVHGPYGIYNEILGYEPSDLPAGNIYRGIDLETQPDTHAAPVLRIGIADSDEKNMDHSSWILGESDAIHGDESTNAAGAYKNQPGTIAHSQPPLDAWIYENAGTSNLVPVPRQLQSLRGLDRVQGMTVQNENGMDMGHESFRYPMPGVPGNYQWLQPGSRPMLVDGLGRQTIGVGQDSPFEGQNPYPTYSADGAALGVPGTEYDAPPEAYQPSGYPGAGQPTVWASDGMW